jgi:hypothetical protein
MALLDRPLDQVSEADIVGLIGDGVRESAVFDYKRQTYGANDAARAEYLADVSSFANTAGGDLVIGVEETEGLPTAIRPFTGDVDQEIGRLEQMARTGLDPRLPQMSCRAIPVDGGNVLVVRIRRSFTGPHRVTFKGGSRFWARAGTHRYEPDVAQLKRMFNEGPDLVERVKTFRDERVAEIANGRTPIAFDWPSKLVVHVVPLPAYADDRFADVVEILASGTDVPLPLTGLGRRNRAFVTLEGYVNAADEPGQIRSYAQVFRSGVIEGVVETSAHLGEQLLSGAEVTNTIVAGVRQYRGVLSAMGAGEPVYALISLTGVHGFRLVHAGNYVTRPPLDHQRVDLPAMLLDASRGIPASLRPAFNVLWNAFGLPTCDMYDADGNYRGV